MPPAAAPPAPRAQGAPAAAGEAQPPSPLVGLIRMGVMWWLMRSLFSRGGPPKPASLPREAQLWPAIPRGSPVDLAFLLTEDAVPPVDWAAVGGPVWEVKALPLGTEQAEREVALDYMPSEAVQRNGSLWLHAFMAPAGTPLDPASPGFNGSAVYARAFQANAYLPRPKNKTGVHLLEGRKKKGEEGGRGAGRPAGDDDPGAAAGFGGAPSASPLAALKPKPPREVISYLKPNLTLALVDEFAALPAAAVPPHYAAILRADRETMTYAPMAWLNDFWLLRDGLVPLNATTGAVRLRLSVYAQPAWKFMMLTQMQESFRLQQSWGAMAEGEPDELKRIFTEGNPYFLALTVLVSMAHSVLDALAFKADVGFWKGKKDVKGLSVRTIAFNAGCQAVILLYLLDNDTSMVVLGSSAVGLLIECWKLTQAMDVTVERGPSPPPPPGAGAARRAWAALLAAAPARLAFKDKASYTESDTDQYDREATRFMSWALIPCVLGYSVYSLKTQAHRSFYSWAIASLVGAVYAFGFVLMCPQLWINYRLKSVAHLPWRQLVYKFVGTIVDDLFAFVIKMPTLHRVAVFRDDVVFCVYLYQRWIYRVDRTRANEFGYAAEEEAEVAAEAAPAAAGTATAPAAVGGGGAVRRRGGGDAVAENSPPAGEPAAAAAAEPKKEL